MYSVSKVSTLLKLFRLILNSAINHFYAVA